MDLMTMLEATGNTLPDPEQQGVYVWEIHGLANSTEQVPAGEPYNPLGPVPGTFPTPHEAYLDLVSWLHEARLPAAPSTAQIQFHVPFAPGFEVTHVVRIG